MSKEIVYKGLRGDGGTRGGIVRTPPPDNGISRTRLKNSNFDFAGCFDLRIRREDKAIMVLRQEKGKSG